MTKPLYFYNGSSFELVGPTTPQSPIAYQTSAPTAPATGDLWIDSDGDVDTYNRQLTRYYFVATAGQTSVSGIDANGLTLAYVAGSEAVYVNGALQVRGQDYTATNGTSITGLTALAVNDVVEIFAYTAFTVANAYTKSETDGLVGTAAGLKLLTPTSIAVGSGSGSVGTSGTVTFSGASSLSLNGVFTSTYENYLILGNNIQSTSGGNITMRLRVGGADNSSANYNRGYVIWNGSALSGADENAATSWAVGRADVSLSSAFNIQLNSPFTATYTSGIGHWSLLNSTDPYYIGQSLGTTVTTSYTGFTLFPAGNMTGSISVYGYKI